MLLIRLIQLTVFCTVCLIAFGQGGVLGEFASDVTSVGKAPPMATAMLSEMR